MEDVVEAIVVRLEAIIGQPAPDVDSVELLDDVLTVADCPFGKYHRHLTRKLLLGRVAFVEQWPPVGIIGPAAQGLSRIHSPWRDPACSSGFACRRVWGGWH